MTNLEETTPLSPSALGRRRASTRRLLKFAVGVGALLFLAAGGTAWLALKGHTISTELGAASALVSALKDNVVDNDAPAAAENVSALKAHTKRAREAAADPLWTIAGELPWIGANFQATTIVATSADDVAQLGAAPLVSVFETLDIKSTRTEGEGIKLTPLVEAEPSLKAAAHAVRQSSNRLSSIDAEALIPQIASPLIEARDQLTTLRDGLDSAADIASILPAMMGEQAPRSYLLLIQNNAEARATGGIPGALAVLSVDRGKLSLGSQSSASAVGTFTPVVSVDAEQEGIYSVRLGKFMQDVNLTPDYPTAARTAQEMWERKTGNKVDGVLSIDPVALGYVLEAAGSVSVDPAIDVAIAGRLPTELTAKNVVRTLLSDVYLQIDEPELQDVYFAGVAKEVFEKLSAGAGDTEKVIASLTRGAGEHRVQLWSTNAGEQAVLAKYPLSGSVTGDSISPAQFGVYFNDGTGAKMDYHVKRTVQLIEECPANGYAAVKVRITSTNTAPKDAATSLPPYVTGGGAFGVPAGSVQTNVIAYGPVQSNVETAFVGGKKTGFASQRHGGRPVGVVTVRLAPGESSTVDFTFGKIVQHTEPKLSVTPTVQALKDVLLDTALTKCAPAS
ncbi:DUF4012 domain-containing protein [Arthrobacter sp. IA7]|uniref:DUF4012 domain-containing protein n=1 Tax=Arthrobacter ipis TaxID=2716202 RepID=UPI0016824D5D|nr:DUF4012 domain-containing protein [Arthrobacter ipis]MBD1541867.1 DUF4012 domain-containing protein [Arthrobacter ipis]